MTQQEDREEFLNQPNVAVLATVGGGGRAHAAPIWYLYENGVFIIPDFLCNAGGVTVSYFEQVQNAYNYYWPIEEVYEKLDDKMTSAFCSMYDMAQAYRVNNRIAAYLVAVSRVAEAVRMRGWV